MLKSSRVCGSLGGTEGINRLLTSPAAASSTTIRISTATWLPAIAVPIIWPKRIAKKVPDSIRPLPIISSSFCRYSGRMAYFTGPNSVEWVPIRNRHSSSKGAELM